MRYGIRLARRPSILVITAFLIILAGGAAASESPPVNVRIDAEPGVLPISGQLFRFTIEFETATPIDLVTADVVSERNEQGDRYWEVVAFVPPVEVPLVPGSPLRLECEVMCVDASQPIFVDYRVGSYSTRKIWYLLPTVDGQAEGGAGDGLYEEPPTMMPAAMPAVTPATGPAPKDRVPGPVGEAADAPYGEQDESADAPRVAAKNLLRTARGRVMYLRAADQHWTGCDGCTVRLYDENNGEDSFLGAMITDPSGRFWIDFPWFYASDPDLYVEFETSNDKVEVERPEVGDPNYQWTTATRWDASGTQIDLGWMWPAQSAQMPVLHIHSQLTRAWRQLADMGYGHIPTVDVRMPDSDWPHYTAAFGEIYLPSDWLWDDGTAWHEYGHHIITELGNASTNGDYCNAGSRCDQSGEPCRHCAWCEETEFIAWREGFPNYVADYMTRRIEDEYATHPYYDTGLAVMPDDYETNDVCSVGNNGTGGYDNPSRTEGILAALLRDLDDGTLPDIDPMSGGLGKDAVAVGGTSVFHTALDDKPITPWLFLGAFISSHPGLLPQIWSTAYNNGFNIDETPPGIVSNLSSPSHATSGQSPDATIEFTWTAATDDIAGILGYSVWLGPAPMMPDASPDIEAVTSLETDILVPGTYWFSIRAVDKAAHVSGAYATYGPITIRDPYPADMAPASGPSFAHPLVPRNAPLTFVGIAPEPSSLLRSPVYLNLSVRNWGEEATVGPFNQRSWIDGQNAGFGAVSGSDPVLPLQYRYHMNQGPFSVPGGRHTLGMRADGGEELAEWSELNNFHAQQWIFAPHPVNAGTPFVGPAPVRPYDGWLGTAPPFQAVNSTGLRLDAGSATVSAMVVMPLATEDDYDARSHAMSLGALSGFHTVGSYAYSMRDTARIDAVLVVPAKAFATLWDVGVVNANPLSRGGTASNFEARKVDSVSLPFGAAMNVNWLPNEPLSLFHHDFNGRDPQPRVIELIADPGAGPLNLGLYDPEAAHAALGDHIELARTDPSGHAKLFFTVEEGIWPIAVWRDPVDAPGGALPLPATAFTVEIRAQQPDLQWAWLGGWSSPVVPRPASDGTPSSVPPPSQLQGDAAATWLNTAFRNFGPVAASAVRSRHFLDDVEISSEDWGTLGGGDVVTLNASAPIYVSGGRHTVRLRLDPLDQIAEESEANNAFATQWAWRPPVFAAGANVVRPAPPAPTAGWAELVVSGSPNPSYNVDGLRTPLPTPVGPHGHWQALAVMPGSASDVDLRLHEASDFPGLGFSVASTFSLFGAGQSDYVLADFRVTTPRSFDVGVVGVAGSEPYTAAVVASQFLASQPAGNFGPFPMPAGRFLDLHEVELPAGPLMVRLVNTAGSVDWGLTLHRANVPLQSKCTPMQDGESWTAGVGQSEQVIVQVPEAGQYCVAVWKAHAGDLEQNGEYRLEFGDGVATTPPPAIAPDRTTLTRAVPNPFNPRTTLHYDVARPGRAILRLFDVRGRLVRVLENAERPAGRHEAVWDGKDDEGRPVTSGVYLAQLALDGSVSRLRVVLLR